MERSALMVRMHREMKGRRVTQRRDALAHWLAWDCRVKEFGLTDADQAELLAAHPLPQRPPEPTGPGLMPHSTPVRRGGFGDPTMGG